MFTCPVSGSSFLFTGRPSASSGSVTNPGNAYDLPSSKPDDPPYSTYADVSTVTGSGTSGTPDYAVVEFNTFPSKGKSNFSDCHLTFGLSVTLWDRAISSTGPPGKEVTSFVTASLNIDYQVNGADWVNIKQYYQYAPAQNLFPSPDIGSPLIPGTVSPYTISKETLSVIIPAASFTSNLNNLKIRFRLGTCTNNVSPFYTSSGFYSIWDIRANLS